MLSLLFHLQSEISLTSLYSYPNAIADARESLRYQQQLLPEEHEIIAEAHFKLSLALEFASVTSQQDEEGAAAGSGPKEFNQELRDEAVKELAAAIASTKAKLQNKEVELATLHNPEDNEITRKQISETKEIIADMEQRVSLHTRLKLIYWTSLLNLKHSSLTSEAHPLTCKLHSAARLLAGFWAD